MARALSFGVTRVALHAEEHMKSLLVLIAAALTLIGCHEHFIIDTTPPAPPQGVFAVAKDNAVELSWLRNTEPDVEGYSVWVSDRFDGKYSMIGSTQNTSFLDYEATNGVRQYYGVTAYDYEGNESDLSRDVVYATPRPEGYGVRLDDCRTSPNTGGYDFSTYSIGKYNDDYTDVFFESYNGRFYLNVWDDTDIQDMGFTRSLDDIAEAPSEGWAPSRSVEAIVGHTYVIWTWDDHYAKVRVRDVTPFRVTIDWAYQTAPKNPELKRNKTTEGHRDLQRKAHSGLTK